MKNTTLEALKEWAHVITAAVQDANPAHEQPLRVAMTMLHDAIDREDSEAELCKLSIATREADDALSDRISELGRITERADDRLSERIDTLENMGLRSELGQLRDELERLERRMD